MKDEVAVLNPPYLIVRTVSVDVKHQRRQNNRTDQEVCVKDEVDVLGSQSLIVRTVSVDVTQH